MKTDRTVVITGAAGGMRKLAVERFLANGDTVVATDTGDDAPARRRCHLRILRRIRRRWS